MTDTTIKIKDPSYTTPGDSPDGDGLSHGAADALLAAPLYGSAVARPVAVVAGLLG